MKTGFYILFLTVLSLVQSLALHAQDSLDGNAAAKNIQVRNAVHVYNEAFTGPNSLLYHGVEYIPNALYVAGDAFFLSDQWRDGDVCIECKVYENVPLLYDIFKDQLVLRSWNKIYRILLDKQNVRWFTIGKHRFVCIDRNDSTEQGIPPSGYYEELIRGPVILLAKRVKSLRAPASAGTVGTFEENDQYYIRKRNEYFRVRTERSLLKIFKNHKRELKQYLSRNRIDFGINKEATMMGMIKYENQLDKSGE